ncbi:poly(ADP-ribose) glycohydrolase-like [Glandiceps talaboti]
MSNKSSEPGRGKRLRQRTLIESFTKHKPIESSGAEKSKRKRGDQASKNVTSTTTDCETPVVEKTTDAVKKRRTEESEDTAMSSSHDGSSNDDSVKQRREILAQAAEQRRSTTPPSSTPTRDSKQQTPSKSTPHKTDNSPQRQSTDHQVTTSPYFQSSPSAVASTSKAGSASNSPVVKRITSDESSAIHSDVSETMEYDGSMSLFSDSDQTDIESQEVLALTSNPGTVRHVNKGADLTKINRTPDCAAKLPTLKPDKQHVVMIRPHIRSGDPPRPWPDTYKDYWNADYVKMPCSKENLYPVDDGGQKKLLARWELIQETLLGDIKSTLDLEEAILKYNIRYSNKWDFRGLHCFFTEILDARETMHFFKTTLPAMIRLALQLPNICTKAPPLLKKQQTMSITLSQQQIACLLANAFFCTFPRRNAKQKQSGYSSYPDINFVQLFKGAKDGIEPRKAEKLKCILNYFKRVTTTVPTGTVTYTRRVLRNLPRWDRLSDEFRDIHVTSKGSIEDDGQGMLQVDFANKYLGGGVLGWGCVQEEIRFLICPEMIISRLFTEALDNNECLVMTGCERFSDYTGYANSFQWAGDHKDKTQRDSWGRLYTEVIAIDAIHFRNSADQYKPGMVKRETDKAYCGFYGDGLSAENLSAVATGNWGCGAFGGDPRLKALIQMMAASVAKRDLVYFTFDDPKLADDIHNIHTFIKSEGLLVAEVWSLIKRYQQDVVSKKKTSTLFEFMYQLYHDYDSSTDNEDKKEASNKSPTEGRTSDLQGDESPDYGKYTP